MEGIQTSDGFIAHVALDDNGRFRLHDLRDHLSSVARLAADFASAFHGEEWAALAGRWHDLGKFQEAFQRMIRTDSGYDAEAHLEGGSDQRVDHSTVGAVHAVRHFECFGAIGAAVGRVLAYLIAGHHAGLPDWEQADGGQASLSVRLERGLSAYQSVARCPAAKKWMEGLLPEQKPPSRAALALWIRMLFSCLVDADYLDTEKFMDPPRAAQRGGWRSLREISENLDHFLARKACFDSPVNAIRSRVLEWCRRAALEPPGIFTLTVPTGGGKTLSSLAFALRHALQHDKTRVIYVIPYTSIIEQTADVLREALGEEIPGTVVLEHHSNLEPEQETANTRLACENWDAPVVVTTSVQFFESLFAARPGRVRKLHNIVNSVVILDEVQLLPPEFLAPILDVLQALSDHFGVTILLMTATQPCWTDLGPSEVKGLARAVEIVPDPQELHSCLRRTDIHLPSDLKEVTGWESLADALMEYQSVLCIVNRRHDARVLFELLRSRDPEAIHLSALMCGAHRASVIRNVRARLAAGQPTRVVSTQLVEAGVDFDFPVVFRALAGLDSIAQAAGRCNREGKAQRGQVFVFIPPTAPPPGILRRAESVCRTMILAGLDDPLHPTSFQTFFRQLYWLQGDRLDEFRIRQLLDHLGKRPDLSFSFRLAASRVKLIRDEHQGSVVVRWAGHPQADEVDRSIALLLAGRPSNTIYRSLQRSVVTVARWYLPPLVATGALRQVHDHLFVQEDSTLYDDVLGLLLDPIDIRDPEELLV